MSADERIILCFLFSAEVKFRLASAFLMIITLKMQPHSRYATTLVNSPQPFCIAPRSGNAIFHTKLRHKHFDDKALNIRVRPS